MEWKKTKNYEQKHKILDKILEMQDEIDEILKKKKEYLPEGAKKELEVMIGSCTIIIEKNINKNKIKIIKI